MQRAPHRILRGRQFVELGILQIKIALPHRALHVGNGVAHHAAQPSLRLRPVNDLLDRRIHQSRVQHGRIVAAAAPLRGFRADRVLHVLDRFAIPLIVKRRKMVCRAEPLVVDIFVAAFAGIGLHEELAGNFLPAVNLRRAGEERSFGPVAFPVHVGGRHHRILNAIARLPAFAHVARTVADPGQQSKTDRSAHHSRAYAGLSRLPPAQPTRDQQSHTRD